MPRARKPNAAHTHQLFIRPLYTIDISASIKQVTQISSNMVVEDAFNLLRLNLSATLLKNYVSLKSNAAVKSRN